MGGVGRRGGGGAIALTVLSVSYPEAELGPSLDPGLSETVMKEPAATFRLMSALPSERVHGLQAVSRPFLIRRASFSSLGEKLTPNWCGWEGEDCPRQGGQTVETVGLRVGS